MPHTHSASAENKKKLLLVFLLTTFYMMVEVVGGLVTNSLALLADAAHMFTDAGALGLALLAVWYGGRDATPEKTYGYYRAEILAALTNSVILLVISLYIFYEAWQRFKNPTPVMGLPMLVIASLGLVVNLVGLYVLYHSSKASLNVRGAYLELLSDTLGSLGVIGASVVIMVTGWQLIDLIMSVGIGLFIIPRTVNLLNEAVHILMEGTPRRIDIDEVRRAIASVRGVKGLHDVHVWTLTSGVDAMSAHVVVDDLSEGNRLLHELETMLRDKFDIHHTTIQLEEGQEMEHAAGSCR